jgi:hypothetical protein
VQLQLFGFTRSHVWGTKCAYAGLVIRHTWNSLVKQLFLKHVTKCAGSGLVDECVCSQQGVQLSIGCNHTLAGSGVPKAAAARTFSNSQQHHASGTVHREVYSLIARGQLEVDSCYTHLQHSLPPANNCDWLHTVLLLELPSPLAIRFSGINMMGICKTPVTVNTGV